MSSHMFEEVERTCQRVGIVRRGRMATVDSLDALKSTQRKRYRITLEDKSRHRLLQTRLCK